MQPDQRQLDGMPARDTQIRRIQNIWERFGRWQSAVGAAGIRMQEFGSLFQEHSLESVGASCKTVRNPSSYLRLAQGGCGASSADPAAPSPGSELSKTEGSRPLCQGAEARWVSHPFPVTAAAAPGVEPLRPPAPRAAAEPLLDPPRPLPVRPAARSRAAVRGGEQHTASWAGFFFFSSHLFLLCAPRTARPAHGSARAL